MARYDYRYKPPGSATQTADTPLTPSTSHYTLLSPPKKHTFALLGGLSLSVSQIKKACHAPHQILHLSVPDLTKPLLNCPAFITVIAEEGL